MQMLSGVFVICLSFGCDTADYKFASHGLTREDTNGIIQSAWCVMYLFKKSIATIFVMLVPLFLVASSVRWVIDTPLIYSYGFTKYDISSYTGIDDTELINAAGQIRDYFNNDETFLDVKVTQKGVRKSIYNDREVAHMVDVKRLVKGVFRAQLISGTYLLGFVLVGFYLGRRRYVLDISRHLNRGGVFTLTLILLVSAIALTGFKQAFLLFHLISFSNDLWQLDPRTDYLIAMFPEGFFFDATVWIAASTIIMAILLCLASRALLFFAPKTNH